MIIVRASLLLLQAAYPHASEKIGTVRESYDGALSPEMAVNTFRNIDRLFPTRTVSASAHPLPLTKSANSLAGVSFIDRGIQYNLDQFLELNRVSGVLVLQDGRIKLERYLLGNTERTRWMSMSVAKSITSTLIGAAVKEGKIRITDSVTKYVPSLRGSAYDGVSVRDVLMMSSGVKWNETYTDPSSDRRRLLEAQISQKAGSALGVMSHLLRVAPPRGRREMVARLAGRHGDRRERIQRDAAGLRKIRAVRAERRPCGRRADTSPRLDHGSDHSESSGRRNSARLRLFVVDRDDAGIKA